MHILKNIPGEISQEEFINIIKRDHQLLNILEKTWESELRHQRSKIQSDAASASYFVIPRGICQLWTYGWQRQSLQSHNQIYTYLHAMDVPSLISSHHLFLYNFQEYKCGNIYIWIIRILLSNMILINNWLRLAECWHGLGDLERKWKAWHNILMLLVLVGIPAISDTVVLWACEPWCQYCISAKTRDTLNNRGCPQIIMRDLLVVTFKYDSWFLFKERPSGLFCQPVP